jgi:hypothetical protein
VADSVGRLGVVAAVVAATGTLIAGVAALLTYEDSHRNAQPAGPTAPAGNNPAVTTTTAPPIGRDCMIGKWNVVTVDQLFQDTVVKFTGTANGPIFTFSASGSAVQSTTVDPTTVSGTDGTSAYTVTLSGTLNYTFAVSGDQIAYTNGSASNFSSEIKKDGTVVGGATSPPTPDYSETFQCSPDSLTLTDHDQASGKSLVTTLTRANP